MMAYSAMVLNCASAMDSVSHQEIPALEVQSAIITPAMKLLKTVSNHSTRVVMMDSSAMDMITVTLEYAACTQEIPAPIDLFASMDVMKISIVALLIFMEQHAYSMELLDSAQVCFAFPF